MPADVLREHLQSTLGSAYTLERELGGGGMSRVYVAREEALGRDVVVKVLSPELAAGVSAERFAREIRLAAALQEPHIVPVLSAGVTGDGLPYYTMPYVRGESLRARLTPGPVPLAVAVPILRDVATALEYAHARGVVHRDIKPENVLLSGRTAVVTDFGIAKALRRARTVAPDGPDGPALSTQVGITEVGASLGTPAYMAPEQAAGDGATDHRADLYAWGVVAYELLAGRHPFRHCTTRQALLAAQMAETPAPLPATVPRPLAALVLRCLAKTPAERPTSASEVLVALDAVTPVGMVPRRPLAIAGVAAIALVALGGAALAWRTRGGALRADESTGPTRLAVLPFEHEGPPEQAIFADGLTDALTAKLAALPALAVIDRHSAAQYRNTPKSATQIGTELGVRYLLEGVVRWARDAHGMWRAQVIPTLVDVRSGTTKWTGEPEVITPADPFTAQGQIATDVARALEGALRPGEAAGLRARMTDDPEAFAAYTRGIALYDALGRAPPSPAETDRMRAEFALAVARDSSFSDAWGMLVEATEMRASQTPDDSAAARNARVVLARALAHVPGHPRVLLALAGDRRSVQHDSTAANALIRRAVAAAAAPGNDAATLSEAGFAMMSVDPDTGYALMQRAAALDPRNALTLWAACYQTLGRRGWADARRYAEAILALDSTDERGWNALEYIALWRGDTAALRQNLVRALAAVPQPSDVLLQWMAYAGEPYRTRFLALSARDVGIATLWDSVDNYYESKADVFRARGDEAGSRIYADSIRMLFRRRVLAGHNPDPAYWAFASAVVGDTAEARRTLAALLTEARRRSRRLDLSDAANPYLLANTYARLSEPDSAVYWLETAVTAPRGGWTARGVAVFPSFRILHGTPAFERFLQAHARDDRH